VFFDVDTRPGLPREGGGLEEERVAVVIRIMWKPFKCKNKRLKNVVRGMWFDGQVAKRIQCMKTGARGILLVLAVEKGQSMRDGRKR
jgi:hypothetical protein